MLRLLQHNGPVQLFAELFQSHALTAWLRGEVVQKLLGITEESLFHYPIDIVFNIILLLSSFSLRQVFIEEIIPVCCPKPKISRLC